ncbi:MAG: pyridoxamine 5'-phosphate oxidase family protein [Bulleidia sp.]
MRRQDRMITDMKDVIEILEKAKTIRIGLYDGNDVHIIPLSYGYLMNETFPVFYFHSAKEGLKTELLKKNGKLTFEIDVEIGVKSGESACTYSFYYRSVMGHGNAVKVAGEEKITGLCAIMNHQAGKREWTFEPAQIEGVDVYRIDVNHLSGKQNL